MVRFNFPEEISEDVKKVLNLIPLQNYGNVKVDTSTELITYQQSGKVFLFPYRLYSLPIPEVTYNKLSLQQKHIADCIYSRSCDGYVRQKHLEHLLSGSYPEWSIPYIIKISDEYVVEILKLVYQKLSGYNNEKIRAFCLENQGKICKSYSRMISYWNVFYRHQCYRFHDYIGYALFRECFGYTRSWEQSGK